MHERRVRERFGRWSVGLVCLIVLLAAALRLRDLDRSPLRGDEAFAARYWAAPPAEILDRERGLAWVEPHPLGTYFLFWAWKALAGPSEFAMRALPALVNLLGAAAMFALGRRAFRSRRAGLAGALLWAINPNLIWHSQDARNYAIWAGLSAVALWLFLRATDPLANRRRRLDWALYILAQTLALYVFFLEAFLLVAQGVYALAARRAALRGWLLSLAIMGALLLPWFGQAAALAGSGYRGAVPGGGESLPATILSFWARLLVGELPGSAPASILPTAAFGLALFWGAGFSAILLRLPRAALLIALVVLAPTGLQLLAASRLAVFDERYLMGITPALLLPLAVVLGGLFPALGLKAGARRLSVNGANRASRTIGVISVGSALLLTLAYGWLMGTALDHYFGPDSIKAPDWYGLRDVLRQRAAPDDLVIVSPDDPASGVIDPAYAYYWPGPLIVLPYPGADSEKFVREGLAKHETVWFVPKGDTAAQVEAVLQRYGARIGKYGAGRDFTVEEWRRYKE